LKQVHYADRIEYLFVGILVIILVSFVTDHGQPVKLDLNATLPSNLLHFLSDTSFANPFDTHFNVCKAKLSISSEKVLNRRVPPSEELLSPIPFLFTDE
jgi:hypothetical protein